MVHVHRKESSSAETGEKAKERAEETGEEGAAQAERETEQKSKRVQICESKTFLTFVAIC
jgi:hypothetical protein